MSESGKISYEAYTRMLRDPDLDEADLAPYVMVAPSEGGAFTIRLIADPTKVEMSADDEEVENAMSIGNGASRWRRKRKFKKSKNPITLVSEGDSWFQFPILLRDTIDNLSETYRIRSLGAAGDTAHNMVFKDGEYLRVLNDMRDEARGFLLSAAGNDVLGEDEFGTPVLERLVLQGVASDTAVDHLNSVEVDATLGRLVDTYTHVFAKIRSIPNLGDLPMIIHGYDYAIPGGYPGDPRDPIYASQDKWLGKPLNAAGIVEPGLQREVVRELIDALYKRFGDFADTTPGVHLVDVRNTLPNDTDWADEIHPNNEGFARVAARFEAVLATALT